MPNSLPQNTSFSIFSSEWIQKLSFMIFENASQLHTDDGIRWIIHKNSAAVMLFMQITKK